MSILIRARGDEWDNTTLRALMEGSQALGLEAWGVCGLFYRPYLNLRFGPPQLSTDADVAVRSAEEAVALDAWLQKNHPWRRWSVCADTPEDYPYGRRGITLRLGAVRMVSPSGYLEVVVHDELVLDHLHRGVLALNESVQEAYGTEEQFLRSAVRRARKLVREYPGLTLEGRLTDAYASAHGKHVPQAGLGAFAALHKRVQTHEAGTMRVVPTKWQLSASQLSEANEVVRHYRMANRHAMPVPPVAPALLPEALEAQRTAKHFAELRGLPEPASVDLVPPVGFASWLHYMSYEVEDASWREWLLNQSRARQPFGGKDAYLASILDYSLYAGKRGVKFVGEQQVTHGGWELNQHLVAVALQLSTDGLVKELTARSWDEAQVREVRAGMRLGALVHDTGKLVDVYTPGSHGGASATLWSDTAPEWVGAEAKGVAMFSCIGHDYFGRLARAITEKVSCALETEAFDPAAPTSYRGAVTAEQIAQRMMRLGPSDHLVGLRILRLVWEADAGSVQSLRWLLPIAELMERLVRKAL